jgi:cysteine synthase
MPIHQSFSDAIGHTPLIRIESFSDETGCEILGKAEFLNPGGSVNDRVALGILESFERQGLLKPGGTLGGVSRYLKQPKPERRTVVADPMASALPTSPMQRLSIRYAHASGLRCRRPPSCVQRWRCPVTRCQCRRGCSPHSTCPVAAWNVQQQAMCPYESSRWTEHGRKSAHWPASSSSSC